MNDFLILLLKGNVFLLLFYLVYRLCFKRFTFFGANRVYLLLSLPLALFLAGFSVPLPQAVEVLPVLDSYFVENPIASSPINAITTLSAPVTPSTDFGPSIWMLLYLFGASGGLLRLCYRLAQVRGLVRRGHRTTTRG
ncbi:MAG: hypothetical protein KTR30_14865, partial [Saprospiraceae bacterium]|nr:hypothetical protein [Saprospiraceae bacterium]